MKAAKTPEEKYKQLTETPVKRLIISLAVPTIISMMVSAIYNMADTFFIGKISTEATGAAGVVFSYMALVQAFGFFFGQGSGNFISRALGRGDNKGATEMTATGIISAVVISLIIVIPCLIFAEPILGICGATETMMEDAKGYFFYIVLGTPFMMLSFVLNNILRFQGNASYSMVGIASGAVLNIILDPIFIFVFGLGVKGASLATAVAQAVGFFILFYILQTKGTTKFSLKAFKPTGDVFGEIVAGGLPSLARQGLACLATIVLNLCAKEYGDPAIAAFTVVNRSTMICVSALLGFGQGFQPVCGYNFGAGLHSRVKEGYWFCVKVASVGMLVLSALFFIFSKEIICLFRADDPLLIEIGTKALRIGSIALPFMGFVICSNMYLQNTRRTAAATLTAIARQGLIFIPVTVITKILFGLAGIQCAQAISDFATFLLTLPIALKALKSEEEYAKMLFDK